MVRATDPQSMLDRVEDQRYSFGAIAHKKEIRELGYMDVNPNDHAESWGCGACDVTHATQFKTANRPLGLRRVRHAAAHTRHDEARARRRACAVRTRLPHPRGSSRASLARDHLSPASRGHGATHAPCVLVISNESGVAASV